MEMYMFEIFDKATKQLAEMTSNFVISTSEFFKSVPTNADDAKVGFEKLKTILEEENEKTVAMWKTYQNSMIGMAAKEDIDTANAHAQDIMKAAGLTFLVVLPGTLFFLPFIINMAKDKGVDIVPESFKKAFGTKAKPAKKS